MTPKPQRRKESLDVIIKTMIQYRGKPKDEPLSLAEGMLCLVTYFTKI